MSAAADFRGDYSPGGLGPKTLARIRRERARERARRAGIASGVARRRRGGRPRQRNRSRGEALALAYRHRQLTRARFDALYEARFPRPEHPPAAAAWQKGRDTLWTHYLSVWRLYRACGQHARTTNGQRGAALSSRGRPRCRRTIQRLNRRCAELGLALFVHRRDQGATPGRRDCLVVEIRTPHAQHVTPPAGAGAVPSRDEAPALPAPSTPPASAGCAGRVPPDGGGQRQAATPPVTWKEQLEAEIRFQQLKLDAGWPQPQIRLTLERLQAQLRLLEATPSPAPGSPPPEDSDGPHNAR